MSNNLIDECGILLDRDITIELIGILYDDEIEHSYADWYKEVKEKLIYCEDGYFTLDGGIYTYLGGPEGYSGIYFQTLESWLEENKKYISAYTQVKVLVYKMGSEIYKFVPRESD